MHISARFYAFFCGDISQTYAYLIPKNDLYVIGVGASDPNHTTFTTYIDRFKNCLREEFAFKPLSLRKREVWAIPYGFVLEGVGNTILVGDAVGLCNPLSGEGIRFAVESGIAAHNAILDTIHHKKQLVSVRARAT